MLRLLVCRDGVLGLFAKRPKPKGGASAHVVLFVLEGFDQRRNDLRRVTLSFGQEASRSNPVSLFRPLQIIDQLLG